MKRNVLIIAVVIFVIVCAVVKTHAATVYLKSGTIDTRYQRTLSAANLAPARGAGYYLVSLNGPVTDKDRLALTLAGAEILEYIPDFTFLVRIEHSCCKAIRKLAFVDWVGPFYAEYKREFASSAKTKLGQYIVRMFPGKKADRVIKKAKAHEIKCGNMSCEEVCRVLADSSQLAELAKSGEVAWIEPYVQPKLCNDAAGVISGISDVRQDLGFYGFGQIVGIADAGLDTGDLNTISADFAGRINKFYTLRRPGEWSDLNGHGTHTTGSMLGSGALSGSSAFTHSYNNSFAGVAPEAKLVFQSIGDSGQFVFPPLHLGELFQPAYDDGVRVHSNSWGTSVAGQYTVYSNEVDQFIWDNKDFNVVFAVGNEAEDKNGDGIVEKDSIYAPATAKNCIAVGATESDRTSGGYQMGYGIAWPSSYPAAPIKYDPVSNNINGMAAYSGRGPTDDNRIKPDICAPGANIISSRTHAANISGWQAFDSNYIYWGGTSMSTPQVAGAAALVREYLQKEKGINPSAAMVKATLLQGAVDMAPGQYGAGSFLELQPAPDFSQGWGRMNVKQSLCPDPPTVNEFADVSTGLSTGASADFQYLVTDTSVPFKATIVWSDYPGSVHAAKELVNDLDITVTSPTGKIYKPSDRTNNIEQVKIKQPEAGAYTLSVTGYNVPMGPQDYALAVSGGLPNTYISGTVKTASGAGVSGATVALVSSSGIKRVTTNTTGKYLTHVPPGAYSVQVSKLGWTFTPRAKTINVVSSAVTNVDFVGSGAPGNLAGTVTGAVGGVVSHIIECPHPYLNSFDQTYTITAHDGATRVRVHFAEIDLMSDGDMINILDANDNIIDTFTDKGEDIWSSWAAGNAIKIRLITNDYGNIGYGFFADGYETDLIGQGAVEGVTLSITPTSASSRSAANGSYSLNSVPAGTYTITPAKANWKFQPASKTVEIPAGGTLSGVDFTAFPPGSISGETLMVSSQTVAANIQSPHPYPDNYSETWQITADPNATRIRLHFSILITEPAWDYVYLMDGEDNIIEIFTDAYTDLWTPWVSGNIARIMLTSDPGNNDYGFKCDKYEVETMGSGLSGATVELSPENLSVTTSQSGSFVFPEVVMGSHSVLPKSTYAIFDPPLAQVNISAGMAERLLFYVKPIELSTTSPAKAIPDGVTLTLRGLTVAAAYNGFFYVQSSSRLPGLRVQSDAAVSEGQIVDVTGALATVEGERRLNASAVVKK
ncbi:MAG: S8 family serine peptidase [Armatimonadetes bacterium]|nr:S8 family serine peptidase [Armatimonadota bacterium]